MQKYCVLDENKLCDDCGECNVCDLDPNKICDNCMKCLQTGADYNAIEVDEILVDESDAQAFEQVRRDLMDTPDDGQPFDCFRDLPQEH